MDYHIIRGLNKPYTRFDFVIGGVCQIVDGIVDVISFGYVRSYLHMWWSDKTLHRFCKYYEKKIDAQEQPKNV